MKLNRITLLALGLTLTAAACDTDSFLEVEDPDVVTPIALKDTANLPAVRGFGLADFSVAYGGGVSWDTYGHGVVLLSGLMSDELFHAGTFQQHREFDKRRVQDTNAYLTLNFRWLHRARRATEIGSETWASARGNVAQTAELQNLNAYTYVFFSENWCSGVPFSQELDGSYTFGEPFTTAQMQSEAIRRFETALATATSAGSSAQQNLAIIGKARVLLNQEKFAEAAALVAAIPTTYAYRVEYSANSTRQNNGLYANTSLRREIGIANRDGGNGLNFRMTPADPRVPWSQGPAAADAVIRQYTPLKYNVHGSPIDLASGIEARLIEAEAALAKGASDTYLPILNGLRATLSLAPLTDPGSATARVDQFFSERAFWLYAQGHRLSDMRRLVRQYGRNPETVFPTGNYVREGFDGIPRPDATGFGTDVNFPIPFSEVNNPRSQKCLNRDA